MLQITQEQNQRIEKTTFISTFQQDGLSRGTAF